MDLKEAQEKYAGAIVKDKGYSSLSNTQMIFKSEVNKKSRIVCLFNGTPHRLPPDIQESLKAHVKTGSKIHAGIVYEDERFIVPSAYFVRDISYLPPTTTTVTTSNTPLDTIVSNAIQNVSIHPILVEVNDLLKEVPKFDKLLMGNVLEDVLSKNVLSILEEKLIISKENLVKVITSLILINKQS